MTAGEPRRDRAALRRHTLHAVVRISIYSIALFAVYALAPLGRRKDGRIVLELLAALAVLAVVIVWQIRAIIRSPFPRVQAVQAIAISIPLLIVSFASAYVEIDQASPGSFSEPVNRIDAVYFTVTVLATVGFGDIAPTSDVARLVVTGQMIADLVLLGLIAKVVFNAVQHRRQALVSTLEGPGDRNPTPGPEGAGLPRSSRAGDVPEDVPIHSRRGPRR